MIGKFYTVRLYREEQQITKRMRFFFNCFKSSLFIYTQQICFGLIFPKKKLFYITALTSDNFYQPTSNKNGAGFASQGAHYLLPINTYFRHAATKTLAVWRHTIAHLRWSSLVESLTCVFTEALYKKIKQHVIIPSDHIRV